MIWTWFKYILVTHIKGEIGGGTVVGSLAENILIHECSTEKDVILVN